MKKLDGFLMDERMFGYRSKFLNSHTNETYVELFGTPWECYKLRQDSGLLSSILGMIVVLPSIMPGVWMQACGQFALLSPLRKSYTISLFFTISSHLPY